MACACAMLVYVSEQGVQDLSNGVYVEVLCGVLG